METWICNRRETGGRGRIYQSDFTDVRCPHIFRCPIWGCGGEGGILNASAVGRAISPHFHQYTSQRSANPTRYFPKQKVSSAKWSFFRFPPQGRVNAGEGRFDETES